MSAEADATERLLRMEIMLTEAVVKLTATGAVNLAMLLIAVLKNKGELAGKSEVAKMLESGKDIMAFPIDASDSKVFSDLAKKYKLSCGYIRDNQHPETYHVIIKTEDAELANKIRREAGIEVLPGIDEKKASAGLSENEWEKLSPMKTPGPASTTITEKAMNPTMKAATPQRTATIRSEISSTQTLNSVITQEQANDLLNRLAAARTAFDQGGSIDECRAALLAVCDELERKLTPLEQVKAQAAEPVKKSAKSAEKTAGRTTAPKKNGREKLSVRQRLANIMERAAHEPQHTKEKAYQPKHSKHDLTR